MALSKIDAANFLTGTIPQGNVANASLGAVTALPGAIATGKILQVVTTTKTDATTTSSSSYVDISGMSVSITPSSTSNKVLIMFDIGTSSTNTARNDFVRLMRDSTAIVDPANFFRLPSGGSTNEMYNCSTNYVDSPSTTSATTYKLQWLSEAGVATCTLNRRGSNSTIRTASTITAMEISG
tara:strand:+ start:294 stop:839 length:546 start_codon:yes stop_codon:yes gene_type:complete